MIDLFDLYFYEDCPIRMKAQNCSGLWAGGK